MNVFNKILVAEHAGDALLGSPATSLEQLERRLTAFRNMTGGKGFRDLPAEPVKNAAGLTRGERKRAARGKLWGWL